MFGILSVDLQWNLLVSMKKVSIYDGPLFKNVPTDSPFLL